MGAGYDKEYFPNKDLISCYERMYQKYRMTGALLEKEIELP